MEDGKKIISKSNIRPTKELYKKMYDRILRKERVINILILFYLLFILIAMISSGRGTILNCIVILIMIAMFIFLFRKKDNKIKKIIEQTDINNVTNTIIFYNDCLYVIWDNGENVIEEKFEYKEINKIFDDEKFIYIIINTNVHIVNKKDINEEIMEKIGKKISLDEEEYKIKSKLNIIFITTLFSFIIALLLIMIFIILFNIPGFPLGIAEYSWVFLLFIPLPIYSIVLGNKYKKQGIKCLKNIMSGIIISILLLLCGFISFTTKDYISHSFQYLNMIEKDMPIDFPGKGKISINLKNKDDVRKIIMVKFRNRDKEQLLEIVNSGRWLDYQDFFEGSVDNRYLKFTNHYDYYCNYNLSDKGFNIHRKGDIMLYMAYNTSTNTLFIVEYIEK